MCGIVGIIGDHEAAPIMMDVLKRLEYRGYDSSGIATVKDGVMDVRKAVGKIVNLADELVHNPLAGKSGIGHTRWATHGAVTIDNAHPHRSGRVAVVHNGIVENHAEIKRQLAKDGVTSKTDSDTEAIALMCGKKVSDGMEPREAARQTLDMLEGNFAICMMFDGDEELIICSTRGSNLVIGYGSDLVLVGSDAVSLSHLADRISYLENGDVACVTRDRVEVRSASGKLVEREKIQVSAENAFSGKEGHKHFMIKEILEQPMVLKDALDHYLQDSGHGISVRQGSIDFAGADRIIMTACGTAYYACMVAKYWFESMARIPVEVDIASEFRYREPMISRKSLGIFVSQSGETADTLAALEYCEGKTSQRISIVNVEESAIARKSDLSLPIRAGMEIGVASTKAFTCQLAVLACLALKAARDRDQIDGARIRESIAALKSLPGLASQVISQERLIHTLAKNLSKAEDVLFLGRGVMYPLALEGALKLKEISYIHAEGYAAGELKHGPIALIDEHVPVVVLAPSGRLFSKAASNMQEVMARGAKVILVSDSKGIQSLGGSVSDSIRMPSADSLLSPILYALPAQLLAYHTAVEKGTDIDQPRNLAKSVTVE